MKFNSFLLASFFMTSVAAIACGSSSNGGGSSSVFCSSSFGGQQQCYGYTNLTSDQANSVSGSCTGSLQGKVVSSCPTSGLTGCCKYTAGGISTEDCFYSSDAATDKQVCTSENGTWSTSQ
jgi:hypothetical protein